MNTDKHKKGVSMKRRHFLKLLAFLLPGFHSVRMNADVNAPDDGSINGSVGFLLDKKDIEIINVIIDIVFPRDEIPYVKEAKISEYISEYYHDCASDDERITIGRLISNINIESIKLFNKEFLNCSKNDQISLISHIEINKIVNDIYNEYHELKKKIITGYYTSEAGALKALSYDPIPGNYVACMEIDSSTKAWFTRY